jgi:TonB family protein
VRTTLAIALSLAAAPLAAQQAVGGLALDARTGTPLRCLEVALQDTAGHTLAHTRTAVDGTFRFDSSSGGLQQLEFGAWRHLPVKAAVLQVGAAGQLPRYQLLFDAAPGVPPVLWPDTTDSPPGPPVKFVPPRTPTHLMMRGIGGSVLVRYVVDSTGRVDRSTIEVLESTGKEWTRTVVDYLRANQFAPARRAGRAVCALEYQVPFTFNGMR